ncbi:hypothetical protein [Peteryoungia algae]|nr:hypothetical protein [Rhizobium sp. SSM4.3]
MAHKAHRIMSGRTEELAPPAADDEVDGGVELVFKTLTARKAVSI